MDASSSLGYCISHPAIDHVKNGERTQMPVLTIAQIESISLKVLTACSVPEEDAQIVADSIVYAHQRGRGTHGLPRLSIYVRKIKQGLMAAETPFELVKKKGVIKVFDAGNGFGQVAAIRGMQCAMKMAEEFGVSAVGIRHSNNFGTAGFICEEAFKKNMIGILFSNSAPAIAPTGGSQSIFGTNPLAFAFPPVEDHPPIVLDMATSVAARGKVRLAEKNGEKIPFGWALDANGQPTDDPHEALKGTMVPIGGPKGYGLSMAIDILAGMLPGAAFGGEVKPLNHSDGVSNYGHLLIAIDVESFMAIDQYKASMLKLIKNTKQCGDEGVVLLPGEPEMLCLKSQGGQIDVSERVMRDIQELSKTIQVELPY